MIASPSDLCPKGGLRRQGGDIRRHKHFLSSTVFGVKKELSDAAPATTIVYDPSMGGRLLRLILESARRGNGVCPLAERPPGRKEQKYIEQKLIYRQ